MKKLALITLVCCICSVAQAKIFALGVKGGVNVPSLSTNLDIKSSSNAGFHAGLFGQINIPVIGLGVQPELLYLWQKVPYINNNRSSATKNASFLEIPVNLTWGIDLKIVRPFLALTPYVRYSFTNVKTWVSDGSSAFDPTDVNNFDYGIGLGAGLELFETLQLMGRYSWGLNNLVDKGSYKIQGYTLSLGYIF
ncbi:MAG: PorT family protein [Prevotellaceae bacterium]|jgi:hypothetical protein|nr:PorT family protein [Prevotellaceae bacterium]